MQDNQLHANLTVEEAMQVATALKLGSEVSKSEKEEVVSLYFYNHFKKKMLVHFFSISMRFVTIVTKIVFMLTHKDGSKIDLRELAKKRNETMVRNCIVALQTSLIDSK